jgi:hypothetical protein
MAARFLHIVPLLSRRGQAQRAQSSGSTGQGVLTVLPSPELPDPEPVLHGVLANDAVLAPDHGRLLLCAPRLGRLFLSGSLVLCRE